MNASHLRKAGTAILLVNFVLTGAPSIAFAKQTRVDLSAVRLPRTTAGEDVEALLGDNTQQLTVVVFVSAECPCSNAYVGRLHELSKEFDATRGVRFVGLFANQNETPREIAQYATKARFSFPTLRDPGATVADQLKASVTPEVFIFNKEGVLRYRGRVDDSQDPVGVTRRDLRDALEALLAGREPALGEPAIGCGIVRSAVRTKADSGWDEEHSMRGLTGPWSMSREGSGTAWLPDSSPLYARQGQWAGWQTMWHGYSYLTTARNNNTQRQARRSETYATGQAMVMGNRSVGMGQTLGFRAMFSADPLILGRSGYPLPLQTGETAYGKALVDRQHPHDFVMELATTYSRLLSSKATGPSLFAYLAPVGEPALGPSAFAHRPSAYDNPEAPLGHHWLDSTHITSGVATVGVATARAKLEASLFTGRASDELRFQFDPLRFDSASVRVSGNPTRNLSLSASHAFLKTPEATELYTNQHRTIFAATYNQALPDGSNWQSTLAYGRLRKLLPRLADPQPTSSRHVLIPGVNYSFEPAETGSYLWESALLRPSGSLFGRYEQVDKDELFPDNIIIRTYTVQKITLGGVKNLGNPDSGLGLGASVSWYSLPGALRATYGSPAPTFLLFLRWRTNPLKDTRL